MISRSDSSNSILRSRLRTLMIIHDVDTYRELGQKLGIDFGYLHHLANGTKTNPSDTILQKLGMKKVVTYELLL